MLKHKGEKNALPWHVTKFQMLERARKSRWNGRHISSMKGREPKNRVIKNHGFEAVETREIDRPISDLQGC